METHFGRFCRGDAHRQEREEAALATKMLVEAPIFVLDRRRLSLFKCFECSSDNRFRAVHVFGCHVSGGSLEETGRRWDRTSRHYMDTFAGEFEILLPR